jgi:hypothetical protein
MIYAGFSEGIEILNKCDIGFLIKRSHHKVSDIRWSDSWITIDNIIRRYIELNNNIKVSNNDNNG